MSQNSTAPHLRTDLQSLINQEQALTFDAGDRLGSFVEVALSAIGTLNTFIVSIAEGHFLSAAIQLALQKSATLAYLSYVRCHHAQAELNIRQAVEYACLCAYLMAHPDEDVTRTEADNDHRFRSPKKMRDKAYRWMDKQQPRLSKMLHDIKNQISDTTAHASVYQTHFTFDWQASDEEAFRGSFFDGVDPNVTRLGLLSLARTIVVIVETLRLTAIEHGGFTLRDGLERDLVHLEQKIDAHSEALKVAMNIKPASPDSA